MNATPINDDEFQTHLQELMKLTDRLEVPRARCDRCSTLLDEESAGDGCASCPS